MNAWNPSPGSRKGRFQHQTGCTQHAGLVSQSCRYDLDEVPGNQTGLVKGLLHTLLKGGEMMIHQPSSQNDALRAKGMGIDPCGPPHRLQGLVNDSGSFRMPILGRLKDGSGMGPAKGFSSLRHTRT